MHSTAGGFAMWMLERLPKWSGLVLVSLNVIPVAWVWWP